MEKPNLGRLVEKADIETWKKTAWGKLAEPILKLVLYPGLGDATNNGGSTDYYKFNHEWKEVADIIEDKGMSFNIANCFKACFRLGGEHHSSRERDLNKIIYFAQRELNLLKKKQQ
jgi:hypothetical protein